MASYSHLLSLSPPAEKGEKGEGGRKKVRPPFRQYGEGKRRRKERSAVESSD